MTPERAAVQVVVVSLREGVYHGVERFDKATAITRCGEVLRHYRLTRHLEDFTQCTRCGAPIIEEGE